MSNTTVDSPKKKKVIHGYTGDSKIEVRQRLPKSVVNCIVKATPSLRSNKGASILKNSAFIDNFFNSKSRQEWFHIGRRQKSWMSPAMQHVKMVNDNDTSKEANKNQQNESSAKSSILSGIIDSDVFGIKVFSRLRYQNKYKKFKWKLKNRKKHNQFIKDCIKKENKTLNIDKVLPLHKLWNKYANRVMSKVNDKGYRRFTKVNKNVFNEQISKLDLHGCLIKIIQCKSRRFYSDYEGIVVFVSKNRIMIVTTLPQKNKLINVPFKGTAFTFELCHRLITIYGDRYHNFTA